VPGQNLAHDLTTPAQPSGEKAAQPAHAGGTVWACPWVVTTHLAHAVVQLGRAHGQLSDGEVDGVSTHGARGICWAQ
jgi:hypothetical protein